MHASHMSDRDLVFALDGELSADRQAVVDAHLRACASCTARQRALQYAAGAARREDDTLADRRLQISREALRVKLADIESGAGLTSQDGLMAVVTRIPRWLAIAATAAAAIVFVHTVEQSRTGASHPDTPLLADGVLPVRALTPGATRNLSATELCSSDNQEPRPIADTVRAEVVRRYGMERVPPDQYELDYLITPELGGAPAVENLWPQRYASRAWNAFVKDQLEELLPALVCNGTLPLQTAQQDIAGDWIAAYKKYFHTSVPLPTKKYAGGSLAAQGDDAVVDAVWRSGEAPVVRVTAFLR